MYFQMRFEPPIEIRKKYITAASSLKDVRILRIGYLLKLLR